LVTYFKKKPVYFIELNRLANEPVYTLSSRVAIGLLKQPKRASMDPIGLGEKTGVWFSASQL
jgi:hypothetical protein